MATIALVVAYDGSDFYGWQDNKQHPSVEATLREPLERILQHPVQLHAASRTDIGVHAEGQVVHFTTSRSVDLPTLRKGANCLLPRSVVIRSIHDVPDTFHSTLSALSKEYHYSVCCADIQLPTRRHTEWHYPCDFNFDAMQKAAQALVGTHDFRAFCNQRKDLVYPTTERTLYRVDCIPQGDDCWRFELEGDAFLYKMARNLVGTLVYVGCGKLGPESIPLLLASHDRTQAGMTAPAHGLALKRISYAELTS